MEPDNTNNQQSIVANHTALLAIFLIVAGGLYLVFGNPTTVVAGGIILLIAHLAVGTGIFLLIRRRVSKAFKKFWGSNTHQNSN